jgi:hypothetical protein
MTPESGAPAPRCPACGAIAARADRRGRVRWRCPTAACPVAELEVGPASRPGRPARRDSAPPGGPSLPWGDEPTHS